jgi:hypothetical protein
VLDPFGKVLTEIRDAPAVAALTDRVRGGEAAPDANRSGVPTPGDIRQPRSWVRFVVLSRLGVLRWRQVPVQTLRIGARCYGTSFEDATRLYGAVSDAIHEIGPRLASSGLGIFVTADETGGASGKDPDNGQPYESMVISVIATTQPVLT